MSDVAFAADEAYAPHAATLLRSLITSNDPTTLTTHFLHPPGFSPAVMAKVLSTVEGTGARLRFHEVQAAAVAGLPSMGRISQVMWYRLLLPQLLPATQRILYLDCDTLVLDDIAPLWSLKLEGCEVAAVSNVFPPDLLGRPAQLGLPPDGYFNSGVLLMDLDAWRADNVAERLIDLVREHPDRVIFPDQDALNIVLGSSRLPLHPRWNCQNSVFYYPWAEDVFGVEALAEARANPAIVHFEGPAQAKPWHSWSTHPYQQAYLDHRAQTPWPKVRMEGETLGSRLRRSVLRNSR